MRWLLAAAALAACGGTAVERPVPPGPSLDDALPCVVEREASNIASARTPVDALISTLDVRVFPASREAKTRYVEALARRLLEMRGLKIPRVRVRAVVANALLQLGSATAAREQADAAIAEGDLDANPYELTLVRTATGGEPPVALDGAAPAVKLAAAEGYARDKRSVRTREILASMQVHDLSIPEMGIYLQALAWLGDAKGGRSILAQQPDLILRAWFGRALVDARHPEARAIIDESLAEVRLAVDRSPPDQLETAATVWNELVWYRETLDAATAGPARAAYDTWLLAADDGRADLRHANAVRAADAGNLAEAERLLARLDTPMRRAGRVAMAMLRDDVTAALDALEERDSREEVPRPAEYLLDAADSAEAYAWLLLSAKQRTPAQIRRFHGIVCRPTGRARTSTN